MIQYKTRLTALGPLIGAAAINTFGSWRAPLWIVSINAAITLVVLFFVLPETSRETILYRRAKRVRKRTGRQELQTEWERSGQVVSIIGTIKTAILITTLDPAVVFINLQIALTCASINRSQSSDARRRNPVRSWSDF